MRWEQGRSNIEAMLAAGELERVSPSADHAAQLLAQARKHVASGRLIVEDDPEGAFQLLYDAARKALWAILENQIGELIGKVGDEEYARCILPGVTAARIPRGDPIMWGPG